MSIRDSHLGPVSLVGSLVAAAALAGAAAEFLFARPESTSSSPAHLLFASAICGAVALLPRQPAAAVLVGCCAVLAEAVTLDPSALFGTGLAVLVLGFGGACWLDRTALAWAVPVLVGTSVLRDLRDPALSGTDTAIDVFLMLLAMGLGWELRRRGQRARDLEHDLAGAEARVSDAVEVERTRLARELHDIVAHAVSIMVVQASTSRPLAERESRELADVLTTIETTGREALLELRRLLGVLRGEPVPMTDPMPRLADIERIVDRMRESGLAVDVSIEQHPHLSRGLDLCVFRVIQEGLTNALRHAPGSRVEVSLQAHGDELAVSVTDDGSGTPSPTSPGSGVGLIGLRERVSLFGGSLVAGPHGHGYRVRAVLPLTDTTRSRIGAAR